MTYGQKKIKTLNIWKYQKTISNIEQAKSNPRNSVIIKNNKTFQKKKPFKQMPKENFNKPNTNLVDGSYSLLVQYYVKKHGGSIVNGFNTPVDVIVRVHETDTVEADHNTIIFDPWRSYPQADNVVYYCK